jgi:membrane peptidoglycan carboxypeptidase
MKRPSPIQVVFCGFGRFLFEQEWQIVKAKLERLINELELHPEKRPPLIAQLFLISGEDRRHGQHCGFDWRAILRAALRGVICGTREGASTIEQQIVRVVTGRFERTFRRKVREILLASLVAAHFPKRFTPAVYLSIGYYGWRMNNFSQASRRLHFRPSAELSITEAASLVARLKYPEPRIASNRRRRQIGNRIEHLRRLSRIHYHMGVYDHLGVSINGPSISYREEFVRAIGAIPQN